MRETRGISAILAVAAVFLASASGSWLHVYHRDGGNTRMTSNPLSDIDSIYYSASVDTAAADSGADVLSLNVASKTQGLRTVALDSIDYIAFGENIPTLYIDTDPPMQEITSKEIYTDAILRYIPYGDGTDTLINEVAIRGRGNSTWWSFPKKPYRLKFDKKQKIGSLTKAKSYAILAGYLDNTMLKDAVAHRLAELLETPYANHAVHVNLVLNGRYRGIYMITEKVGINSGSVDIDEKEGILWEWDTHYDEKYQFKPSSVYNIPCMVKDPDFDELAGDSVELAAEMWEFWKADLRGAMEAVKGGRWKEAVDSAAFVDYVLVNHVLGNHEILHPKSLYLYKENAEGKYKFGPVWDFDWAMGYELPIDQPFLILRSYIGMRNFFRDIITADGFLEAFRVRFEEYRERLMPRLLEYIEDCRGKVRIAAYQDAMIWPEDTVEFQPNIQPISKTRFDDNIDSLKQWILNRAECIGNSENLLLY